MSATRVKEVTVPTADELLSAPAVIELAECLRLAAPNQGWARVRASTKNFDGLALGERAVVVRDALLADLPASYAATAKIVRKMLKNEAFTSWMIWPVGEAATRKALASKKSGDFEDGLRLLAQLTGRFSSEFAIRSFLNAEIGRASCRERV